MSLPSLVGVVGFFLGIVLHLFLFSVVLKRSPIRIFERVLLSLVAGLFLWYGGNFLLLLLRHLDVEKISILLGAVEAAAFTGLGVVPALLFHTHWIYFQERFPVCSWEKKIFSGLLVVLYSQLIMVPLALPRLVLSPALHPLEELEYLRTAFLLVLALSYYGCAYLQVKIIRSSRDRREEELFFRLLFFFVAIPLFNLWVFEWGGGQLPGVGDLMQVIALLASLAPTVIVAYYIYRYQFLHIEVHRSLASALLILLVLILYLAVIRGFGTFLEVELSAPPMLLEATFLVTLLLLFPPLSGWLQRGVSRTFEKELAVYRSLAEDIGRITPPAASMNELEKRVKNRISQVFPGSQVALHAPGEKHRLAKKFALPLVSGGKLQGCLELLLPDVKESPARKEGRICVADSVASLIERYNALQEQVRLERELARKSHLEDLGRMAETIAHNVRNPLSSLKTLLQLRSESTQVSEDEVVELKMMTGEIDRLAQTVARLLRFSRLGKDHLPTSQISDSDVRLLLEGISLVMRASFTARGVLLRLDLSASLPPIRIDSDSLNEILSNLLSNALDASSSGDEVVVSWQGGEDFVLIEVRDQGKGIDESICDRVFEPFFTTKGTGNGLGLAIVKRLAEQFGGKVVLEPAVEGKGTLASVTIPVSRGDVQSPGPM